MWSAWFENNLATYKAKEESKKERKRGCRDTEKAAALQRVEQYVAPPKALEVDQYGDTKLPDSVLIKVMVCLAKTCEPGGLRGFACVAKDLANASLANWDLYRAAKEGWAVLGEEARTVRYPNYPIGREAYTPEQGPGWYGNLPTDSVDLARLPGDSLGWEFWELFLRDPLKPRAKELEAAMKLLRLKPKVHKGTKAEMAVELLGAFGLNAATTAPVMLLYYVKVERSRRVAWDGPGSDSLHLPSTRKSTS